MQKAVQRLDGVEKVTLSLNRGLATVELKPANRFRLDALEEQVRDSGFTAGQMEITAAGEIIRRRNRPAFRVSGRKDLVFFLAPATQDQAAAIEMAGTKVVVTGTVVESRRKGEPDALRVEKIQTPARN